MCGIFGLALKANTPAVNKQQIEKIIQKLFRLSETRGSEASGIAIANEDAIGFFKRAEPASKMLKSVAYKQFIEEKLTKNALAAGIGLVGHSRLVTNGTQGMEENNQPVFSEHCVGVHNGIVVNDLALYQSNPSIHRHSQVDSEVIYRLIDKFYINGDSLQKAIINTYHQILGEANIAFLHTELPILGLATNVGSLYYMTVESLGLFIFASERHFLKQLQMSSEIKQLLPGRGLIVNTKTLDVTNFSLHTEDNLVSEQVKRSKKLDIVDRSIHKKSLIRCTSCILPQTFPFIDFDEKGVCNFCRAGSPTKLDTKETLEKKIESYRSKDGSPDCIVALSGGRDSCYGLHVIKKELGLNPIAYTYDWAMVTDEARRNCARVCGELGVEHIIRSADILSKRRNIRANIEAWMCRPDLGMIPLFMAGDKQFFHYASQVSRQNNMPLVFFCGGNNLEVTHFKTGFCGIKDDLTANTMMGLDLKGKLQLLMYYAKNYLLNPRYLNRSVFDTIFAFFATYINRQEFVYLYRYIDWDEKVMTKTLTDLYGWESASDSQSTWRIGDGTAAFYNYIYHTVAGFSEHDTFRSNQIRAGLITRDEALVLVAEENKPRYAAMQNYANLVGFSLDEALVTINRIPKLV